MNEWIVNRRFAYIETSLVVLQYDDLTKKGGETSRATSRYSFITTVYTYVYMYNYNSIQYSMYLHIFHFNVDTIHVN
jgi:hypothetical protein